VERRNRCLPEAVMSNGTLAKSTTSQWIDVTPSTWRVPAAQRSIRELVSALRRLKAHVPAPADVDMVRAKALKVARGIRSKRAVELVLCVHVFCDLRSQGWQLRCSRAPPSALRPAKAR